MSKAWFIAMVLVLIGSVSLALGKVPDGRTIQKNAPPKAQSTPSAPKPAPVQRSAPAPTPRHAPAPRQAPTPTPRPVPVHRQASTPTSAPAPAARVNPTHMVKAAPSAPVPNRATPSSGRIEHSSRHTESRSNPSARPTPAPAAPAPVAPKIAPKMTTSPSLNLSNAAPSVPTGKVGKALGSMPSPSNGKIDLGKSNRSTAENHTEHKHTEHKHESSKPVAHGSHGTSPLPTAPKFETNGKSPPFGSSLTASKPSAVPSAHHHGHSTTATPRLPSNSLPGRKDHDDHRDHRDSSDDRHTSDRRHDDHDHSHRHGYSSGPRRSRGLSWLILGGSSLGRNCYGYGYGPGYCAPTYSYTAPSEVYVSTTVVQPEVSINSYSAASVIPPQQQQLTPDEFAALPLERQRELLLQALNALEEDLTRSPNGEDWSRHLQLATIAKLVTDGEGRPDATLRARLRSIVQLFDEVAGNTDYKAVSDLMSFRVLHMGLHEFAAEEIDRSRRQLSNAASNLSKSLEAWSSGQRWRDYLQVEWMIGTDEEMQIELEARLARFEKLLEKFDRVKSDDQFQVITQSPEFGLTHESLHRFVSHLQQLVADFHKTEQQQPSEKLVLPAAPQ